ncbi:MAG: hypothetical protein JWN44_1318 [Myxococcales bacterium]|nr:hypothetical protein [Myxococcales bacterium]
MMFRACGSEIWFRRQMWGDMVSADVAHAATRLSDDNRVHQGLSDSPSVGTPLARAAQRRIVAAPAPSPP